MRPPLEFFLIIPLIFILIQLFTDIRWKVVPNHYFSSIVIFPSLVIGFIFLYATQKYDKMDANVPVVERNIIYLEQMAKKYNPSTECYLKEYVKNFLDFTNNAFPILDFEREILPQVTDENDAFRIREAVTILELIAHERITKSNLIPDQIWYLVLVVALLLTTIFPMDAEFQKNIDPIVIIILIWLPLFTIYYLYDFELKTLENTMENLLHKLC